MHDHDHDPKQPEPTTQENPMPPEREPSPNWRTNARLWISKKHRTEQMLSAGLTDWTP